MFFKFFRRKKSKHNGLTYLIRFTYGLNNGEPDKDEDSVPVGAEIGDGLIRYEEYRGFIVQGAHTRLSPTKKDVFVFNDGVPINGCGWATTDKLTAEVHCINGNEYNGEDKTVNFNHDDPSLDQKGVRVIGIEDIPVSPGNDDPWGLAQFGSNNGDPSKWSPNTNHYAAVYVAKIGSGYSLAEKLEIGATEMKCNECPDLPVGFIPCGHWHTSGFTKIDDEVFQYLKLNPDENFTDLDRPKNGTTEAEHAKDAEIKYFINYVEVLELVFAHEVGHAVGLQHATNGYFPNYDENIMNKALNAGSFLGFGYFDSFHGISNTVLNDLKIKYK